VKTYTFHVPADQALCDKNENNIRIILDGFYWPVLVFGFLWFFTCGHFMAGAVVLTVNLAVLLGFHLLDLPQYVTSPAFFLLNFFFALEASSLIRWVYEKKGMKEEFVIVAKDKLEAELKGFSQWLEACAKRNADIEQNEYAAEAAVSDKDYLDKISDSGPWSFSPFSPEETQKTDEIPLQPGTDTKQ